MKKPKENLRELYKARLIYLKGVMECGKFQKDQVKNFKEYKKLYNKALKFMNEKEKQYFLVIRQSKEIPKPEKKEEVSTTIKWGSSTITLPVEFTYVYIDKKDN